MKYKLISKLGTTYSVVLPKFIPDSPREEKEACLMSHFYDSLGEAAIKYSTSHCRSVRKYRADCSVTHEDGGVLRVEIKLTVRMVRNGKSSTHQRILCQRWKNGKLVTCGVIASY